MAAADTAAAWKPSKPRGKQRETDHKTGPKGEPMTPIPSATLIVLCPRSAKDGQGRLEYDTLMVQRSARDGSSFRSAVVFPGGALDIQDEAAIDAALSNSSSATSEVPPSMQREGYMRALKLCALRETFEETGLLLLPSPNKCENGLPYSRAVGHEEANISADEWTKARNDVHHNAVDFVPFLRRVCDKLGLRDQVGSGRDALPGLAPMAHHSNWITPRGVVRPAKRFDAHFFVTILDAPDAFGADKTLQLSADGSETLSLRLGTPQEIMHLGISDQISLFPPQFYILADLESAITSPLQDGSPHIRPLIFDPSIAASYGSAEAEFRVTPVEEEGRGLQGRNYSWDRKDVNSSQTQNPPSSSASSNSPPTSWISDTNPPLSKQRTLGPDADANYPPVTAVEPRAFPKLGAMIDVKRGLREQQQQQPQQGAEGESEDSFVFPLVLPGDWQASPSQKERASKGILIPAETNTSAAQSTAPAPSSTQTSGANGEKTLNRLYVSPRAPEHGGGMTVRGAVRRGLGPLPDFQIGIMLTSPSQEDRDAKL
ncbi:hypothetical protein BCV70DRAFT_203046 [Testicularia cyperi]|uniref:Nudix hydrolase domain-containing protein n=1 Tax=Testicularia cyperi TaxID=1882483 RepID=A0A317XIW3_9BASI|nr:hypothetical protein BCV70DRAFT_203046 [Testicularia cyperi]